MAGRVCSKLCGFWVQFRHRVAQLLVQYPEVFSGIYSLAWCGLGLLEKSQMFGKIVANQ